MVLTVVRLEWVHALAARARWLEEKLLLIEETHRILAYFQARQAEWLGWAQEAAEVPAMEDDPHGTRVNLGYAAHLHAQAAVYRRLALGASYYTQFIPSRDSIRVVA